MGISDYKMTLGANAPQSVTVNGNAFHVIKATSPIHVSFNEGKELERTQGMGGTAPSSYTKVTIRSEVPQNITIALGDGTIFDSRSNISATLNTTIAPANINQALPSVVVGAGLTVLLAGANASRKELRIGVSGTNASGIHFGDINTGAVNQGGFIDVGSVEYVTSEGAIYAYNPSGSAVTVNLVDMRRV